MDAQLGGGRGGPARGDGFEVDDGVWILDLGGQDASVATPERSRRATLDARSGGRSGVPILARDARVPVVDDSPAALDRVVREIQLVKDEALSWLTALAG